MSKQSPPGKIKWYRRFQQFLLRTSAGIAAHLWAQLPLSWVQHIGRTLGWVAYFVARERRRAAEANLKACFGDRFTAAERRRILLMSCQNMITSPLELFKLAQMEPDAVRALVDVEGEEHIRAAVAQGRGVIVVTGHYGNWELLGGYLGLMGYDLAVLARDSSDPQTAGLVNAARRRLGIAAVLSRDAVREMTEWLAQGKVLGVLPDQRQAVGGRWLDFLGRPATTALGPAVLSLRTGAVLVLGFARRTSGGRFHVVFYPPIQRPEGLRRAEMIEAYAQKVNDALGYEISLHPEQWLWMHDRWRNP